MAISLASFPEVSRYASDPDPKVRELALAIKRVIEYLNGQGV